MMRFLICLLMALLVGGCATRADMVALQSLNAQKRSFDFFDMRPKDQFVTHTLREEHGDRTYYGDDVIVPSRTELLADQLNSAFGAWLKGRSVVISTFRVQTMQYTKRGGPSYYSSGNPIVDLIGTTIGRELLAATMRSNDLYAHIQIVGKVDDNDFSINSSTVIDRKSVSISLAAHVQTAVDVFLKQVGEAIAGEPVATIEQKRAN